MRLNECKISDVFIKSLYWFLKGLEINIEEIMDCTEYRRGYLDAIGTITDTFIDKLHKWNYLEDDDELDTIA